jgi:hypothetical protein
MISPNETIDFSFKNSIFYASGENILSGLEMPQISIRLTWYSEKGIQSKIESCKVFFIQ